MKPSRRCWPCLFLIFLAFVPLAMIYTGSVVAQIEETTVLEFEPPDAESDGFEQSDLGNVAQTARTKYAEGNRYLAQASKLQRRIAETEDAEKRAKLEERLEGTFQSAATSFTDAIGYAPKMAEAYASLGETLREWGKLDQSLEVCAAAVRRFPDDLENFEGWAMTLMELNLLGNATSAYSNYVDSNPDRAAILMEVMQDWLRQKQADPGDLNPADVDRLAAWIQQQEAG